MHDSADELYKKVNFAGKAVQSSACDPRCYSLNAASPLIAAFSGISVPSVKAGLL